MSEPEIEQFVILFKSFMEHASVEELNYLQREAKRKYNLAYNTYKANELGVTMDYYMSEFNI
tara:strand:- start:1182 stop:1367 length:186 start_codon:yes stop_codon:yes gene_type:complete